MIKRSLLLSLLLVAGGLQAQELAPNLDQAKYDKGKGFVEGVCFACHTTDGNSEISANPKLAGQIEQYILKQLTQFKSWDGAPAERESPFMAPMAALLEKPDMETVAYYFSNQQLKADPAAVQNANANTELGSAIWRGGLMAKGVPACAACHGPNGAGIPAEYPRIGGQFAEYTTTQLKAFREGTRINDLNEVMRTIALKMTDAEIDAVANFAAALH